MTIQIRSGATSDLQTIDPTSKAARVTLYDAAGNIALIPTASNAAASQAGIPIGGYDDKMFRSLRVDRGGAAAIRTHQVLMQEDVTGTSINSAKWATISTTMAASFSTTENLINSAAITTTTTNYTMQSLRRFNRSQFYNLRYRVRARVVSGGTNSTIDFGFSDSTGSTAHANGAYFQMQSSGQLVPVVTFNSTDVFVGDNIAALPAWSNVNYYSYDIEVDDESVTFSVVASDGTLVNEQSFQIPATQARLWAQLGLFVAHRVYIVGGAAASAPSFRFTEMQVVGIDAAGYNMPGHYQEVMAGRTGQANPQAGGQLATYANSAAPASATLSNTTAGYTTLGGLFQFVAVAGAATDYALFGFTVPAPYQLVVTGIMIDCWNLGAAVATTPHLLHWAVGSDANVVSLASGAPLRYPVGAQYFPIGAAIGQRCDQRIVHTFNSPVVTNSGRFFTVILRMPVATATASQIIGGMVGIDGFFR